MLQNFFKTTIRNLKKQKSYAIINISGLAIGLAACLIIASFVIQELSYDRFHNDPERIYRVGYEVSLGTGSKVIASSPYRLAETLRADYSEIHQIINFSRIYDNEVSHSDKKFHESRISFVDSAFFQFFDFQMISGNPLTAVDGPNKVVISQSIATKFFGSEDPIGKMLEVVEPYGSEKMPLTVTGVIEDMPANSHFHIDIMISMATGNEYYPQSLYEMWGWDSGYTYIRLPDSFSGNDFMVSLEEFGKRHIEGKWFIGFFAQPMVDIHLTSRLNSEIEANSDKIYVYIFLSVGLIILILAIVNYMNLATARASSRNKEVGIRKVIGAQKKELIIQFMGESVLISMLALLLATGLAVATVPLFSESSSIEFIHQLQNQPNIIIGFVISTFLVGIVSGSYPAFYLSSFQPIGIIKGSNKSEGPKQNIIRKGLIIIQFGLSTALIVGTILVYKQLEFLRNKNLGIETERVMILNLTGGLQDNYQSFKSELLNLASIESVTTSNRGIGRDINSGTFFGVENNGSISEARLSMIRIDYDYITSYGIQLLEGRNFSPDFISDTLGAVLLNQSALKALDISEPGDIIGKKLKAWQDFDPTVVGVIEDLHFEQLYNTIKPMIFLLAPDQGLNYASIKFVKNANFAESISAVGNIWGQFENQRDFRYSFLDDNLHNLYKSEENFLKVFSAFAGIAIFIACLGIFGLAAYTASQRSKEIGIRKVLGSTTTNIARMLTTEFLKLVVISNLIAWPMSYYVMNGWLESFAYSTNIHWSIFGVSSLLVIVISLGTVSYQSVRAALTNPIEVLHEK